VANSANAAKFIGLSRKSSCLPSNRTKAVSSTSVENNKGVRMQKLSSGLAVRVARIQREATNGARRNASAGRRPGTQASLAQLSSARRRLARARRGAI
jgi:hypothetical protein